MDEEEFGLEDNMEGPGEELMDMPSSEEDDMMGCEDCVECNRDELRDVLEAVEMGELSAEEAFEQLNGGEEMSLDDAVGSIGPEDDVYDECMENVQRIANLITDDPDIMGQKQLL